MKERTGYLIRILFTTLLVTAMARCASKPESADESLPVFGTASATDAGHSTNPYYSRTDTSELHVSDSVWKQVLPKEVYEVARRAVTERAFTGKFWNYFGTGTYYCTVCGNALFRSDAKFESTCGWPSFFEPIRKHSVIYQNDSSYGMDRTEVLCGRCMSHLGHVFDDGPPPTGKRFCMNSVALDFEPGL